GRYLRLSGGGILGCVRPDSDGAGPDLGDPPCGGSTPPQTGLRAWRTDLGFVRVAPVWSKNGAAGAPDTLTVAYGSGGSGSFTDGTLANDVRAGKSTDPVNVLAGELPAFRVNEFFLLIDKGQANGDRGCSLFQLTGTNAASNTLLKDAAGSNWNPVADLPEMAPFKYAGGATPTGGVRSFG